MYKLVIANNFGNPIQEWINFYRGAKIPYHTIICINEALSVYNGTYYIDNSTYSEFTNYIIFEKEEDLTFFKLKWS